MSYRHIILIFSEMNSTDVSESISANLTDSSNIPVNGDNVTGSSLITEVNMPAPCVSNNSLSSWITITSVAIVPLLLVVGIIGNTFTVIVMRSKRYRASPTGVYLTALALSDLIFITAYPFAKSTTRVLFGEDVRAISNVGCKLYFWVFRLTKWCSAWFVATIGCERFFVVWLPLRAKLISNKRVAVITVTCVVTIGAVYEGVRTFNTYIVNEICMPNNEPPELKQLATAFMISTTIIYTIIPKVLLLCATPLTVFKLIHQRQKRREMTHNTGSDETVRITVMLLSVTITYIILVTPISVAHLVMYFQGNSIFLVKDTGFIIFREIAQLLEQLNFVINFFLYVVSNTSFRQKIGTLLKCNYYNAKSSFRTSNIDRNSMSNKDTSSTTLNGWKVCIIISCNFDFLFHINSGKSIFIKLMYFQDDIIFWWKIQVSITSKRLPSPSNN